MNILQVTPYFAPAWAYGGPPRLIYELSRELVRRGNSVTVLTTDAHDEAKRAERSEELIEGIVVHRLRNLSNSLAWHQQMFLPTGTGVFLRRMLKDFDIVHLHMLRTFQNILVHRLATRNGIPYVLSAHGSLPRIVRWKTAKALFDVAIGRRLLRNARRLVALSKAERTQYMSAGVPPSRISIVYNGIDPRVYEDLPQPGLFARMHGLEGKKLVTYIGRLNARKGLDHLLRAFQGLSAARDDAALVLVGPDDGYRRRLERLADQLSISDRVVFTGLITVPDKVQVLVDSNLIVYPASHEIFGLVPFEALLCGRPVVVTDDSGCGEIVESAHAGLTVPFGDPGRLRDAIASGLEEGPEVKEMVRRGRRFVLEQLTWSQIAKDMERVYESAIAPATQAISVGS